MAKKKKAEEHVNLERWMVSYADFMTLLFALFVVLYSFAMAKQSEMQSMAQSIAESFSNSTIQPTGGVLLVPESVAARLASEAESSEKSAEGSGEAKQVIQNGGMIMNFMAYTTRSPTDNEEDADTTGSGTDFDAMGSADAQISSGDLIRSESTRSNIHVPASPDPQGGSDRGQGGLTPGGEADEVAEGGRSSLDGDNRGEGVNGNPFDAVREAVSNSINDLGIGDEVDIEQDEHWLTININSGLMFAEGSASILSTARPLIAKIAVVISSINNYVRVRGYTDNTFVADGVYKNSWDLSAQRSVNVLGELINDGIDPARMAVEAYGEYSPFFSNSTPAGRAQNRRVVIAISRYAKVSRDLKVVTDMPGANRPGLRSTREARQQRAGDSPVNVVRGEDNSITLDFSE